MTIQWVGPRGGLGNRILALGSILALSKCLQETITFPWPVRSVCSAEYHELFEEMPGIIIDNNLPNSSFRPIGKNPWDPICIFRDFKEKLKHQISLEEYCFCFLESLRSLKYNKLVKDGFDSYHNQIQNNNILAIHIRRTDRTSNVKKLFLSGFLPTKNSSINKSFSIVSNTGLVKTLQYSFLPPKIIRNIENNDLAKFCGKILNKDRDLKYSVYVDSYDELVFFQQQFRNHLAFEDRYIPSYCNSPGQNGWGTYGKRNTSIQDALIEILCMSSSTGILQNISLSTFSLCSSIIGNSPILTSQPRYTFWRVIQKTLGKPPYEIKT